MLQRTWHTHMSWLKSTQKTFYTFSRSFATGHSRGTTKFVGCASRIGNHKVREDPSVIQAVWRLVVPSQAPKKHYSPVLRGRSRIPAPGLEGLGHF
mmetsp:Transcript_65613/g.105350  ORF Transcript_65613/g.105350 Transcript_65613/m.105350 type:complete len:96 (-) Transcript_65613:254-541(-)